MAAAFLAITHVSDEDLDAFAYGKLSPKDAARVHTHIRTCDDCCWKLVEVTELRDARLSEKK